MKKYKWLYETWGVVIFILIPLFIIGLFTAILEIYYNRIKYCYARKKKNSAR